MVQVGKIKAGEARLDPLEKEFLLEEHSYSVGQGGILKCYILFD